MVRGIASLVLVAAAAIGPAAADLQRAMDLYKGGKYLESAAEFQMLVDRTPGYDFGHFMIGHSLLRLKRPVEAERSFRRALELNPTRPDYYHGLAIALKEEFAWSQVLEVLAAGERYVQDAKARYAYDVLRGYASAALRRWADAAVSLERARQIRSDAAVLSALASAYLHMGRPDLSAPIYNDLIRRNPDDAETLRLGAESFLLLASEVREPGRKRVFYEEAFRYAQRHAVLRPDEEVSQGLLGRAALGAGRFEIAESAFRRVVQRTPDPCLPLVNLAKALMGQRRWSESTDVLAEAARCAPRLPVVHETLGIALARQGKPEEALAAFRRAESLHPTETTQAWIAHLEVALGARSPADETRVVLPNH